MSLHNNFQQMANYNQWMNVSVFKAAATLDDDSLQKDRGAFFGSILGTLNHILVGDIVWLQRFAKSGEFTSLDPVLAMKIPATLGDSLYDNLSALKTARIEMDQIIQSFIDELDQYSVEQLMTYNNMSGAQSTRKLSHLLQHLFNHQTHHRGQVSTLLSQLGVDVGVTDLLFSLPKFND